MKKNAILANVEQKNYSSTSQDNPYAKLQDLDVMLKTLPKAEVKASIEKIQNFFVQQGLEKTFGITLLHKHFDVNGDEVLVETIDFDGRKQIVQPVKTESLQSISGSLEQTSWMFEGDEVFCLTLCNGGGGGHSRAHYAVEF